MNRLHIKLSFALLAIVLLLGAAFYVVDRNNMRLYYEDLTQRLNASLAMYIANDQNLLQADGQVNEGALSELAGRAMTINPTAEIYVLDTSGNILGHVLDPAVVRVNDVPLDPIQSLLGGSATLPVRNEDPKMPGVDKVFSAAPVMQNEQVAGYLYIVLGGAKYEAIAAAASDGYAQRMALMSLVVLIGSAMAAGLLVVTLLTRRLRRLTRDVDAYAADGCRDLALIQPSDVRSDEIATLRDSCYHMAVTIDRQLASLTETDRLRRELITNVSHDLRTPLASMQGYIETLLIKNETLGMRERERYLDIARRHAQRLGSLIQDLFELAKLDAHRVAPNFERFDLGELIHDVSLEFELGARKANIDLSVVKPSQPIFVHADIGLIQRVMENLVSNALKFTPAGGAIDIVIETDQNRVDVKVSDNGYGIADEDLPRVFDRFFRAKHGEESLADSTGLGLAIAKRILELHGSQIEVTSRVSEGTCFEFELPVQQLAA